VTAMRTLGLIPVLLTLDASLASSQTTAIDQGGFTVTRAGRGFGTESFTIVQQGGPDGATFTLTSTRMLDGRTIRTSLRTDSMGAPLTYARQEAGGSPVTLSAAGRSDGRLTISSTSGTDRASKDYLVPPGTLLLDEDLVHPLYLVCLREAPHPVSYIAPGDRAPATAGLIAGGDERIALGNGQRVAARHFILGTGVGRRDIWIDSEKRLLKVAIPGRQIVAIRDEPPH
jgi:hypothetical protein